MPKTSYSYPHTSRIDADRISYGTTTSKAKAPMRATRCMGGRYAQRIRRTGNASERVLGLAGMGRAFADASTRARWSSPPQIRFLYVAPQVSLTASFGESLAGSSPCVHSGWSDRLPTGLSSVKYNAHAGRTIQANAEHSRSSNPVSCNDRYVAGSLISIRGSPAARSALTRGHAAASRCVGARWMFAAREPEHLGPRSIPVEQLDKVAVLGDDNSCSFTSRAKDDESSASRNPRSRMRRHRPRTLRGATVPVLARAARRPRIRRGAHGRHTRRESDDPGDGSRNGGSQ